MSVSTAYHPEPKYTSTMPPMLEEYSIKTLRRHLRNQPSGETLGKRVSDALGVSAWHMFQQTFGYRWRGEDTLNWGDPDGWIQIKWVRHLVESPPEYINPEYVNACLREYSALRGIIGTTRLHRLKDLYSFRDMIAVQCFLQTHFHLIEILLEAYPYLEKHFESNFQVALEVVNDPEVQDRQQLFAYILTSLPVDEALSRLDSLDKEWFLDQLDRVDDFFNFDLEFI